MIPHALIAKQIKDNECFLRQDAIIVFVCGKALTTNGSKRKLFLDYAHKHIQGFHFLLAEDLFEVRGGEGVDLLTTEKDLANYSDCIIIILESESAFTELGAFAVLDELCDIILPINDRRFAKSSSFINLGPLEKIDKNKKGLGPTIQADLDSFAHCFSEIEKRLNTIQKKRRSRLKLGDYQAFSSKDKERLLLVYDLVNLLAPITKAELRSFLGHVYGKERFDQIGFDLRLLAALGFISEKDSYFISKEPGLRFIDFEQSNYFQTKSEVIIHYRRNSPERLNILREVATNG